jgi:hypothetical protein
MDGLENMMKFLIVAVVLIALSGTALAQNTEIYIFDINVNGSEVNVNEVGISSGSVSFHDDNGFYSIRMVDEDGFVLYQTNFSGQEYDSHGDGRSQEARRYFRLPYRPQAEAINVYMGRAQIKSVNLPEKLCRADDRCLSYCSQRSLDPDCTSFNQSNQVSEENDKKEFMTPKRIGIAILALILFAVGIRKYRNRGQGIEKFDPSSLRT